MNSTSVWNFNDSLFTANTPLSVSFLIFLNQAYEKTGPQRQIWERLWPTATWKICADGGANRLHQVYETESSAMRFLPDKIIGDLDSVTISVRQYYQDRGVEIIDKAHDQDTTDFQKCISFINDNLITNNNNSHSPSSTITNIFAFGALGGRFDQSMSSIHTAFLQQQQQQQQHNNYNQNRIFLFNDHSVACLLFPGLNSINVDSLRFGPTCGLIPIGADQVRCETTGLKWNLDKETALSFSSLVSSSNAFLRREGDDDAGGHRVITLHTDKPLLWTMELR